MRLLSEAWRERGVRVASECFPNFTMMQHPQNSHTATHEPSLKGRTWEQSAPEYLKALRLGLFFQDEPGSTISACKGSTPPGPQHFLNPTYNLQIPGTCDCFRRSCCVDSSFCNLEEISFEARIGAERELPVSGITGTGIIQGCCAWGLQLSGPAYIQFSLYLPFKGRPSHLSTT